MKPDDLLDLPVRPESEVEWEDLLVRLELMPKALRVELEHPGTPGTREGLFADLLERELKVADFLERAAGDASASTGRPGKDARAVGDRVEQFVRTRSRNFAMVQRRGIDVWEWGADADLATRASVYQVLARLAQGDVAALAQLRATRIRHPVSSLHDT